MPAPSIDPLEALALRWAELVPADEPGLTLRLAGLLRRLSEIVAAEPFRPAAARPLGVELFAGGRLGADLSALEDVLTGSLGLLRHSRAVLGARAGVASHRLDIALDEMAAGVVRGLREALCPTEASPPRESASGVVEQAGTARVPEQRGRHSTRDARPGLLTALRDGIDRHEFRLVYQPLVGLADGQVLGAEALVRWQHPTEGLIGPGRFIRLAETSGAIVPLGRWVLAAACGQAAAWRRELAGAAGPYVSVNVSPVQLVEHGWVDDVADVLDATGLPPDRLQLEITEQAVLGDEASTLTALAALREIGVRLALDDFGTGYSSLAWLRKLPVHGLKIDGSFVDGLRHPCADVVDAAIVRALVDLAHALDMEVTAEWVETDLQARRLATLGCDLGQGRWLGDAGPAEWVPSLWRRTLTGGGPGP